VLTKIAQVRFPASVTEYDVPAGMAKALFAGCFCGFFDGLRPDAEYSGFVLARLDYLHSCWAGRKHGADVAIGAIQAGTVSGSATFDCSKPVGLMHLHHLAVILFDLKAGAVHHGKQSNKSSGYKP